MRRYEDVMENLAEVDANIDRLKVKYEQARHDDEVKNVLRAAVTSISTLLRSCLDYMALDVAEHLTQAPNARAYFPYGVNEAAFRKNMGKGCFRNLDVRKPSLYEALASVQPHSCGDEWLIKLCSSNNSAKHDQILKQQRRNSESHTVSLGGVPFAAGPGTVSVSNSDFGFGLLGKNRPLVMNPSVPLSEMQAAAPGVKIDRMYDWVEFHLEGTATDVMKLMQHSKKEIALLAERLHLLLP